MEHNELLKIIEDYHQKTDDTVVGVGYGYKMTNDVLTDELSIVFTVKEKLSKDKLTPDQLLPKTITLSDNTIVNTDVVQGEFKALTCDPNFHTWQTVPPPNRYTTRPLKGGISISNIPKSGGTICCFVGTLGCLAIDNENNSLVGLSNNHVLIDNAFYPDLRTNNNIRENITTNSTFQSLESGLTNFQNKYIGVPKRYYPLTNSGYNYIDVALTTIDQSVVDSGLSYYQLGLSTTTLPFASTLEIDNILATNPLLYSAGRTTAGKGEGLTKLKISQFPVAATISGYENQHFSEIVQFSDLICFVAVQDSGTTVPVTGVTGLCEYPIAGGDSGSALIADIGGIKKIIGLCFAGSPYYAFACRIDRISTVMNVSAWNGETVNYSNVNNIQTHYVDGLNPDPYIIVSGVTYWQAGIV